MTDITYAAIGSPTAGAPDDAQYVVMATDATLTEERVLVKSNWMVQTDGGAGGNVTYDFIPDRTLMFHTDEFILGNNATGLVGELGWQLGAAANTTKVSGITNHPGIFRIGTSNVSGNTNRIKTDDEFILLSQTDKLLFIVRPSGGNSNMFVKVGYTNDTVASEGSVGVYFSFSPGDSANWRTVTRLDASNVTKNTTTVAYTVGNWYLLEIERSGSDEQFFINNTLVFTHTTNIPTGPMGLMIMVGTTEAANKNIEVDFFRHKTASFGQRWT